MKNNKQIKSQIPYSTLCLMLSASIIALTFCSCSNSKSSSANTTTNSVSTTAAKTSAVTESTSPEETTENPDKIDLDALAAIEAKDDFGVKIDLKEIEEDSYSPDKNSFIIDVTITNNTGKKIKNALFYIVAYDKTNRLVNILGEQNNMYTNKYISRASAAIIDGLADGASVDKRISVEGNYNNISGLKFIAYSYEPLIGSEKENPYAAEWADCIASMQPKA